MDELTGMPVLSEDITEQINHGIRVSSLAYRVGKTYGLYESICKELALAGMVHDIGKIKVSSYLYGRERNILKVQEMEYLRRHARLGYEILMRQDFSDRVVEAVLYHHENFDGSGYPENLSGESIPIMARILRVCDVYTALTSDRAYRKAFDKETAVNLMIEEVKNFDMKVFLAFLNTIHEEETEISIQDPGLMVQVFCEEETDAADMDTEKGE